MMTEVLFFGPASQQLLGVYHTPLPARDRRQGVLLCAPFGQEYMRSHRAFRQLATMLAQRGYHVMRFDYRGTGDSAGDLEQFDCQDWLEDIARAAAELRRLGGIEDLALVGLRLGALLGIMADQAMASRLVLWDPVSSGPAYRDECRRRIRGVHCDDRGRLHCNGFIMSRRFQESLSLLEPAFAPATLSRALHLSSNEGPTDSRLADICRESGNCEFQRVAGEHDWNYIDHVGGILMPQAALQSIAAWLE